MSTRASPEETLKKYVKRELKKIVENRPEFKAHLIERGVYGIYISAATKYISEIDRALEIEYRLNNIARNAYPIDVSMTWHCTKQGHDYWRGINYMGRLSDGYIRKE